MVKHSLFYARHVARLGVRGSGVLDRGFGAAVPTEQDREQRQLR